MPPNETGHETKKKQPFDWPMYRNAQIPHELPRAPEPVCGKCGGKVAVRVTFDPDWQEFACAAGCMGCGTVQGVAIRALTEPDGSTKPLAVAMIENLKTVFRPK